MTNDIKKYSEIPQEGPLPEDVNKEAEKIGAEIGGANLLAMLTYARKKRFYGEATHYDEKQLPKAIFNFQNGVCMRYNPITWVDSRNVFKGSKIFYR